MIIKPLKGGDLIEFSANWRMWRKRFDNDRIFAKLDKDSKVYQMTFSRIIWTKKVEKYFFFWICKRMKIQYVSIQ